MINKLISRFVISTLQPFERLIARKPHIVNRKCAAVAALCLSALCIPHSALGQTYYNFTQVWGTNYAPILLHFATQSNLAYMPIQAQTLIVTNINTNESVTVSYGAQITSQTGTNVVTLTSFTTNFPAASGWTNGSTWIYPIPAYGVNVGVSPWGGMAISCSSTLNGTCTNGVGLQ